MCEKFKSRLKSLRIMREKEVMDAGSQVGRESRAHPEEEAH